MTNKEKITSVTVYLAKVVDQLQGVEDETLYAPVPRLSRAVSVNQIITEVTTSLNEMTPNR